MTGMRSINRKALLSAALTLVLAGVGSVALPTAASAQTNYRVCGVYNSAADEESIGSGLVVKIWKGDKTGTCRKKINWMDSNYGAAWAGSHSVYEYDMWPCQDFQHETGIHDDPCNGMTVNKIYRNFSIYDATYPQKDGWVEYWHD